MNRWFELGKIFATTGSFFVVAFSVVTAISYSALSNQFNVASTIVQLEISGLNESSPEKFSMLYDRFAEASQGLANISISSGAFGNILFYFAMFFVGLAIFLGVIGFFEKELKRSWNSLRKR
jgi:hypothetical protein